MDNKQTTDSSIDANNAKSGTAEGRVSDETQAIIQRLKLEGDLIRNSGTNSLKTIKVQLDKFTNVLESIDKNVFVLVAQSKQMLVDYQANMDHQRQVEDAARRAEDIRRVNEGKPAEVSPNKNEQNQPPNKNKKTIGDSILHGMSLLNPGGISNILGKGFVLALAPELGKLAGKIIEDMGKNLQLSPGAIDAFSKAADFSVMLGTIGSAFGAKWGVRGAIAGAGFGVASSFGNDVLKAAGLDSNEKIIGGLKLGPTVNAIFGTVGAAISLALTSPTLWKSMFNSAAALVGLKEADSAIAAARGVAVGAGKVGLSAAIAAGVMSLYWMYGDTAKKWLEEQGMSKNSASTAVDVSAWTMEGVSLGSMFGPQGAIIGAIAGFAIGAGVAIFDYANNQAKVAVENVKKKIDELTSKSDKALKAGDVNTAVEASTQAAAQYKQVLDMGGSLTPTAQSKLIGTMSAVAAADTNAAAVIGPALADVKATALVDQGQQKVDALETQLMSSIQADLTPDQIKTYLKMDPDVIKSYLDQTARESSVRTDEPTKQSAISNTLARLETMYGSVLLGKRVSSVMGNMDTGFRLGVAPLPESVVKADSLLAQPSSLDVVKTKIQTVNTAGSTGGRPMLLNYAPTTVNQGGSTNNNIVGGTSISNTFGGRGGLSYHSSAYGLPSATN